MFEWLYRTDGILSSNWLMIVIWMCLFATENRVRILTDKIENIDKEIKQMRNEMKSFEKKNPYFTF